MLVLDPWDLMGFLKGARYGFGPWFPIRKLPPNYPNPNLPSETAPKVCHDPMSCQRHDCQKVRVLVVGLGCFAEDFVARKQVSQWKSNHWMKNVPFLPCKWKTGYREDEVESWKMVIFHFHLLLKMVLFQPFFGLFARASPSLTQLCPWIYRRNSSGFSSGFQSLDI